MLEDKCSHKNSGNFSSYFLLLCQFFSQVCLSTYVSFSITISFSYLRHLIHVCGCCPGYVEIMLHFEQVDQFRAVDFSCVIL